eukprot:jgi/Mesvir1/23090/Mv17207-RA.1
MTLYPFSSNIPTPTRRSPQAQQRVDELATKIFTPYELQKLRTYIPGIRFVIEEAEQYSQNILEDDPTEELKTKLRKFVGSVYIYDILTNLMRDINERVRRSTDSALGETSIPQMAKLVNALRGLPVSGISASSQPQYIRAFKLSHNALPSYSLLLGGDPTDCSIPARLIQQLASPEIDCSYLGIHHRERLSALGLDFPPDVKLAVVKSRQAVKPTYYNTPATTAAIANYNQTWSPNLAGTAVTNINGKVSDTTLFAHPYSSGDPAGGGIPNDDLRFTSEYYDPVAARDHATRRLIPPADPVEEEDILVGQKAFYTFPNIIHKFIKRDILSFNRLRTSILNNIDQWAKSNGALLMVNNTGGTKGGPGYYSDLLTADYFVSGLPQPGCPSGSAPVFYDRDPSDPKARVVDQYIVAADNTLVENPDARYGPICQRRKGVRDIMSGAPDIDAMGGYANFPQHFMRAYRKRKPAARKSTRSRR